MLRCFRCLWFCCCHCWCYCCSFHSLSWQEFDWTIGNVGNVSSIKAKVLRARAHLIHLTCKARMGSICQWAADTISRRQAFKHTLIIILQPIVLMVKLKSGISFKVTRVNCDTPTPILCGRFNNIKVTRTLLLAHRIKNSTIFPLHVIKLRKEELAGYWKREEHITSFATYTCTHKTAAVVIREFFNFILNIYWEKHIVTHSTRINYKYFFAAIQRTTNLHINCIRIYE